MKVVLIIALCISQTLGGPLFWTPVSVTAPVVVTNLKDFIMSILGVTAIPHMDSVAKKVNTIYCLTVKIILLLLLLLLIVRFLLQKEAD